MSNRDMVLHETFMIEKERKGVLMIMRSVEELEAKKLGVSEYPIDENVVRADVPRIGIFLRQDMGGGCWIDAIMRFDYKVPILPEWLLNYFMKMEIYYMIDNLNNKEFYEQALLKQRQEEKADFYKELQGTLERAGLYDK